MAHRGILSLALALMMCFLLLSHFDSQLFFVHFYESLIYLAIVVILFYFEARWAYMLGMLAPAAWLVLILTPAAWAVLFFTIGGIPGILRQVQPVFHLQRPNPPARILEAATLILSVLMIGFCANHWRRKFAARAMRSSTFLVCLGVVAIYYGVLVIWLMRWAPTAG
jgi:uncharacterized protein YjeT (DUF2065 family)